MTKVFFVKENIAQLTKKKSFLYDMLVFKIRRPFIFLLSPHLYNPLPNRHACFVFFFFKYEEKKSNNLIISETKQSWSKVKKLHFPIGLFVSA